MQVGMQSMNVTRNAWLTADGLIPIFLAARVTLRSAMSASKMTKRLTSMLRRFIDPSGIFSTSAAYSRSKLFESEHQQLRALTTQKR